MAEPAPEALGDWLAQQLGRIVPRGLAGKVLRLAYSGGLDSTVLLHALAALQTRLGFTLCAGHVHHGLQAAADSWPRHCQAQCDALLVPLSIAYVAVEPDGQGVEAAARTARYAALLQMEQDWLVLAHHRADQVETVLFRLLRGAGVQGASAMQACEPQRRLLRPLLNLPRECLLAYAQTFGLQWIEDASNTDVRFARNALRHSVLPLLAERFPGAEANLARAAQNFSQSAALLAEVAQSDVAALCLGQAGSRSRLAEMSQARVANVLRYLLSQAGEAMPSAARLADIQQQLMSEQAVRLRCGASVFCAWRDMFWCEPDAVVESIPCVWQGEACLPWGAGVLYFEPALGVGALKLDPAAGLMLTARQEGDRLRLHPRQPQRSFKTLCQQAGVPPWQRDVLPVLRLGQEAVWIGGVGAAAEWVCGPRESGWRVSWRLCTAKA